MPKRHPTTVLTAGARCVTSARTLPFRRATWHRELWAMKTWVTTGYGVRPRLTALCGFRVPCLRAGLLINMVTGSGLSRGAGPGSMTRLGDTRPSIMAAGFTQAATGDGLLDRSMRDRSTHPRWWPGLAVPAGA